MNERLKALRKELKLSQEDFGKKLGVRKSSISLLESGRNNLTDSMVLLICKEFGVNYNWITTGDGKIFNELSELEEIFAISARVSSKNDKFRTAALLAANRIVEDDACWESLSKIILNAIGEVMDTKKE